MDHKIYRINLKVYQMSIRKDEGLLGFLTPNPKGNTTSTLLDSQMRNSRRRGYSVRRKPIFTEGQSTTFRQSVVFNPNHASFVDQSITESQVMNYDFCGCESKMTPCQIIDSTFLRGVSLPEMKESYMQISQREGLRGMSAKRKNLFGGLPKIYPEVYITHLNNLIKVLEDEPNYAEFNCLAWIQYHSKIEYVTYFLYQDLKKAYSNRNKFIDLLQYELQKVGTNLRNTILSFSAKGYGDFFQAFITDFYDSVGANLVPVSHYAKVIKNIYEKGHRVLLSLLMHFICPHRKEFETALRFLAHGEGDQYRAYIRQLNWDNYLGQLQI